LSIYSYKNKEGLKIESIKIIKKLVPIHCARGHKCCDKCKELEAKGKKLCLIEVFLKAGDIARPTTEIYVGCQRIIGEYQILKIFNDKKEVLKYSRDNNIDIQLD